MSNHYLSFATILLPRPGTDLSRYSVIACDQFTSQPDYWQKVRDYVGNAPSTLGMILPEIYLAQPDAKERIQRIHRTMERYQAEGVFVPPPPRHGLRPADLIRRQPAPGDCGAD